MEALSPVDHRGLLRLAWPILVTMVSYTMLSVVNSMYVGWLGTAELAAVGLASTLVFLAQGFGLGLLSGVRVLVASRTGARAPEDARAHAWVGLWVGLAAGLLAVGLIPLGPLALWLMGAEPDVADLATGYFGWRVAATPLVFVFTVLNGAFQGRGETRPPMVANLLANAVNLVADPVLIFGLGPIPALGIDGAAIGAGMGIALGLLYIVVRSVRPLGRPLGPDRARLTALWRIGSPSGVNFVLDVLSFTILAGFLAHAGKAHLAAHVIVVRIIMASFLPCHALGEGTSVLVAQSLGAGRPELARKALWLGVTQSAVIMATMAVLFVAVPGRLTAAFGAAPDVTAIATPIIVLYGLVQVLDGAAVVVFGALTGAGDTRFTMRAGLFAAWVVKLPVAAVLVLGLSLGAYGAWLGIAAEIAFQVAVGAWRVLGKQWLLASPVSAPVPAEVVPA